MYSGDLQKKFPEVYSESDRPYPDNNTTYKDHIAISLLFLLYWILPVSYLLSPKDSG
jgi:hypothetical protein